MNINNLFFVPWITAAILSFLATPIVIKFAGKLGIVDDPKLNKHAKVIHTYPVPRGGGVAIFLGISIAILIFTSLLRGSWET